MKIIPYPEKIHIRDGVTVFSASTNVSALNDIEQKILHFIDFDADGATNSVNVEIVDIKEDYILLIDGNFNIKASSDQGVFHAVQTLKQLIFEHYQDGTSAISNCKIYDKARYQHRGFMMDVSRHFYSIEFLKKIIDLMAQIKMNVLHLHLSDNQGYRLESEVFPKLNSIGSKRKGTRGDGKPVEGFYTKAQIADLIEYAEQRYITIVPEIDVPGHTIDLIASYPELSCLDEPQEVEEYFHIDKNVLCVSKESTYDFVFKLLDEVMDMFKSKRIHIGADEVCKTNWIECPSCRKLKEEKGFENYEKLQGYFVNRVAEYIVSKGRQPVVWNEALDSGLLTDEALVQFWFDGAGSKVIKKAISDGREMIVSKNTHLYFDYPHSVTSLKKVYSFDPDTMFGRNSEKPNVLGIESPLWTEFVATETKAFKFLIPRLFAVAEVAWSKAEKNYQKFEKRVLNLQSICIAEDYPITTVARSNPGLLAKALGSIWFSLIHVDKNLSKTAKNAKNMKGL